MTEKLEAKHYKNKEKDNEVKKTNNLIWNVCVGMEKKKSLSKDNLFNLYCFPTILQKPHSYNQLQNFKHLSSSKAMGNIVSEPYVHHEFVFWTASLHHLGKTQECF